MIDWSVSESAPSETGMPTPAFQPDHTREQNIELARRFISQLPPARDGRPIELSREEWVAVWSQSQGAESEEHLIAQMVVLAYRLRQPEPVSPVSATYESARQMPGIAGFQSEPHPPPPPSLDPVSAQAESVSDVEEVNGHLLIQPRRTASELDRPSSVQPALIPMDFAASEVGGGDSTTGVAPEVGPVPIPSVRSRRSPASARHLLVHGAHSRTRAGSDRHRARWLTLSSWGRNIGVLLILFAAWQLWGTSVTQHHSQSVLASQFSAKVKKASPRPASATKSALLPATDQLPVPAEGTVMAQLQIPQIDLSEYVVSGTNAPDLAKGPGHYVGTAMPGQAGNVAIAGHRTTHGAPFNRLAELAIGDPIYLTTLTGEKLTYIVSATPVPVSPSDVTVLNNFGDNRITLTTCNPEYSAAQRLIVVAAYKPPGADQAETIAKGVGAPYKLAAVSMGWNWSLLPLVLIEVGALTLLGLGHRRLSGYFGHGVRWLILVPIWMALVLALFEALTEFLPAAV